MGERVQSRADILAKIKKLTKTERHIMDIIWEIPGGISKSQIYKNMNNEKIKSTVIKNLEKKGYIDVSFNGLDHWYKPRLTKKEYEKEMINRHMKNSFGLKTTKSEISRFYGFNYLTAEEADRLEKFIEDLEKESGK